MELRLTTVHFTWGNVSGIKQPFLIQIALVQHPGSVHKP